MGGEREGLNNAVNKLKEILAQGQQESRYLREDNDKVNRRLEELARYQEQLLLQEKILREKIQGYENENNELDGTIN